MAVLHQADNGVDGLGCGRLSNGLLPQDAVEEVPASALLADDVDVPLVLIVVQKPTDVGVANGNVLEDLCGGSGRG